MRVLGIVVLTALLLIGGAAGAYKLAYPTYTYRYRMTVDVMVGDAVRSGSSVIEVRITKQPQVLNQAVETQAVSGEAVFVDLDQGRNIIALLASGRNAQDGNYPISIARLMFRLPSSNDLQERATLRVSGDVPSDRLPTFVTFADLNDPKTARIAEPSEFSTIFGSDLRLKGVRIEMTEDAVTTGIEKKLPWWNGPGRPAAEAFRAWRAGDIVGPSIEPETRFKRGK